MAEKVLLRAENLTKVYGGVYALKGFSYLLEKGQVHALVGENGAGKSTFVKIITGVIRPTSGQIWLEGKQFHYLTPLHAMRLGIQVVHQDLSLFPNLTVAENICAPLYAKRPASVISWKSLYRYAEEALRQLAVDIPLDLPVGALSVGDRQLVAIARAVFAGSRVLILDEPTSALSYSEIVRLFTIIRELKEKGISVIFISHKLDEVLAISDKVTIIRDGTKVGTYEVSELTRQKLEFLMSGEEIAAVPPRSRVISQNEKPLLYVENLSRAGEFYNVTFELYRGEILGLIGPLGAGRTQLALCIVGISQPESGTISFDGKKVRFSSPQEAFKAGIVYCPEDRLNLGLILDYSVAFNSTISIHDKLRNRVGFLSLQRIIRATSDAISKFGIKAPSPMAPVSSLSGGNQQKVVLARILSLNPKLMIVDNPTFGIDVATKAYIHRLLRQLADSGIGILFISDEASELLRCSDRIIIMRNGRIAGLVDPSGITEEELLSLVHGGSTVVA